MQEGMLTRQQLPVLKESKQHVDRMRDRERPFQEYAGYTLIHRSQR